jgi:hypothetical protein
MWTSYTSSSTSWPAQGGAFAQLAKQAFEYNETLGSAFNAAIEADDETLRRHLSLRTNLTIQARRLSGRIDPMEALVQSCAPTPAMRLP